MGPGDRGAQYELCERGRAVVTEWENGGTRFIIRILRESSTGLAPVSQGVI